MFALQLDQVGRRQRVLSGFIELHAAIADHELIRCKVGRLQRRLDLVGFGRAGAIDGISQHEEALHPTGARIVEIAIVLRFEHLIDDVAVASGLADIEGAAVDRPLGQVADVRDEGWVRKAGVVADNDRRQIIEVLHRLEIKDCVSRIADEDDSIGLGCLELQDLCRDIRAVGVVRNLRRYIDVGTLRRLQNACCDGRAVVGVLIDYSNRVDLFA